MTSAPRAAPERARNRGRVSLDLLQKELVDRRLNAVETLLRAERNVAEARVELAAATGEETFPVALCTVPFLLSNEELETLQRMARDLFGALSRAVDHVRRSNDYGERLGEHAVFSRVNGAARRYDEPLFSARFDVILDRDRRPWVLEFNTSCPAGMCLMHRWRKLILQERSFEDFSHEIGRFGYDDGSCFPRRMAEIAQTRYDAPSRLNVALVNDSAKLKAELEVIAHHFRRMGHQAAITPLAELAQRGGELVDSEGRTLDLIYCKVRPTPSLLRGWDESERTAYRAFLETYEADRLAVFNPFPAMTLGEDKAMLGYLRQGVFDSVLSPDQRDAVRRFVPPTYAVTDDIETRVDDLVTRRHRYVLKPRMESRGRFIVFGRDFTDDAWRAALAERCDGQWIAQELIDAEPLELPWSDGRSVETRRVGQTLGVFVLEGELQGVVSRISEGSIHNVRQGGQVQAVVVPQGVDA